MADQILADGQLPQPRLGLLGVFLRLEHRLLELFRAAMVLIQLLAEVLALPLDVGSGDLELPCVLASSAELLHDLARLHADRGHRFVCGFDRPHKHRDRRFQLADLTVTRGRVLLEPGRLLLVGLAFLVGIA